MKKTLFIMMALVQVAAGAMAGNKQVVKEKRQLKGFERIELLGSVDIKYRQGKAFAVEVSAPKSVLRQVETRVTGNKLTVNMKGDGKRFNFGVADSDDVEVYVTSPDLIGVTVKGSGDFDSKGRLDTDNLDVVLEGSGDIDFDDIICDRIKVALTGSGDVEVKTLKALQTQVDVVGSGEVELSFRNSGSVDARLKGSGDIKLKGTVKSLTQQAKGAGTIDTTRLTIRK